MPDYRLPLFLAIAAVAASPVVAVAQAADPARAPVQTLSDALIASMKSKLGASGRVAALQPVVTRSFDLPLMTRLIIGAPWTKLGAADQAAITTAFTRFTVAQYAGNFKSFGGQSFTVSPQVDARGSDRLVRTTLNQPGKAGIPIGYRLRQSGGQWKIIDVFYNNSISQLATRRADFATILSTKGAKALVQHIDALTAKAAN